MIIAPSLLAANFMDLNSEIKRINATDASWIHLDIMDGNFVPNLSFSPSLVGNIRSLTDKVLDVHLMVLNPEIFLDELINAKVDYITIHSEILDNFNYKQFCAKCHENNISVGIAFNPDTEIKAYEKEILNFDLALIMSVVPGCGGQKFIQKVLNKVPTIKAIKNDILIEIDGGVNDQTITTIKNYKIDSVVSGSYLFAGNMQENINKLK